MREYKKDISFSAICISVPTKQNKSKNTGLTLLTLVEGSKKPSHLLAHAISCTVPEDKSFLLCKVCLSYITDLSGRNFINKF